LQTFLGATSHRRSIVLIVAAGANAVWAYAIAKFLDLHLHIYCTSNNYSKDNQNCCLLAEVVLLVCSVPHSQPKA